ncbi:MAG: class I SAM-dependent methyltransferase, partial [Campylobacterota bacterium]|nr:class I SAM-dependent methyltransferase [Campylobacterota bacterium]
MKKIDNKEFYHKAIKEYGISAQGVHWNSKYTQYKRFEIITKLISKKIKDSTIIDAGCGFGEYYNYLSINNRIPKKYIGIDCEKNMIDIAKKRFPQEQFEVNDILKDQTLKGDYYICSGSMNILELDEIELFIKNCFENSSKGFV